MLHSMTGANTNWPHIHTLHMLRYWSLHCPPLLLMQAKTPRRPAPPPLVSQRGEQQVQVTACPPSSLQCPWGPGFLARALALAAQLPSAPSAHHTTALYLTHWLSRQKHMAQSQ